MPKPRCLAHMTSCHSQLAYGSTADTGVRGCSLSERVELAMETVAHATVVGVDAHKRSHTLVVVDQVGRKLGEKTIPTTTKAHTEAMRWVKRRFA
jgi:hypothetical protein